MRFKLKLYRKTFMIQLLYNLIKDISQFTTFKYGENNLKLFFYESFPKTRIFRHFWNCPSAGNSKDINW